MSKNLFQEFEAILKIILLGSKRIFKFMFNFIYFWIFGRFIIHIYHKPISMLRFEINGIVVVDPKS